MASQNSQIAIPDLIDLLRNPANLGSLTLGEWDSVLRLARSANLIGRIAGHVERLGLEDKLPEQVRRHLCAVSRLIAHQQEAIVWECRHLELALKALSFPVVLLKGAAYVQSGQTAAKGRLFGDVDLLVPLDGLNAVEAALMLRGWSTGQIDPYDQRYYRRWMHELPPMTNIKRGTVVDVHHNILPISTRYAPDATLLLASSVVIEGSCFRVLAPNDMVIHSATHLFHEGEFKNGLRDLYDLDALLTSFSAGDHLFWDGLLARAEQLGLVWPVYLAMRYTNLVLGTNVPAASLRTALQLSGIGSLKLKFFDSIYLNAFAPDHVLVNRLASDLARLALYLRAHKLRMPIWHLSWHLGRKAWLRLFKHTSRSI